MKEDIKVGDIVTWNRQHHDVLAVCGQMYAITEDKGRTFEWLTLTQLIGRGYRLHKPLTR